MLSGCKVIPYAKFVINFMQSFESAYYSGVCDGSAVPARPVFPAFPAQPVFPAHTPVLSGAGVSASLPPSQCAAYCNAHYGSMDPTLVNACLCQCGDVSKCIPSSQQPTDPEWWPRTSGLVVSPGQCLRNCQVIAQDHQGLNVSGCAESCF